METRINIDINENNRKSVVTALSKLLADEYVVYTKERNAHWNVVGADFSPMHAFFESLYDHSEDRIDSVAERIRALGAYPPASLNEFLQLTQLKENLSGPNSSLQFIEELLSDHETIIRYIRSLIEPFAGDYQDEGTSDFITGLIEEHEKTAWMLRAHLINV